MVQFDDSVQSLCEQIASASARDEALRIVGGDTKHFIGRATGGTPLSTRTLAGVQSYEPSELVITAGAGTRLGDLNRVLDESGQALAFEPPEHGADSTLGGVIACGLSGPARPYMGSARDFVLGVECINGNGERLRFGGQVMKNVAGYDVSRLLVGSFGSLAVLTTISLKVLPKPEIAATVRRQCSVAEALTQMNQLATTPQPVSATAYLEGILWVRFSGATAAVRAAEIGFDSKRLPDEEGRRFWEGLKDQRSSYFQGDEPLWRLSLPSTAPNIAVAGQWLIEWGGAQRWLRSREGADIIRTAARVAGGFATLFRGGNRDGEVFPPLETEMLRIHRQLKEQFDPNNILNRGILYPVL